MSNRSHPAQQGGWQLGQRLSRSDFGAQSPSDDRQSNGDRKRLVADSDLSWPVTSNAVQYPSSSQHSDGSRRWHNDHTSRLEIEQRTLFSDQAIEKQAPSVQLSSRQSDKVAAPLSLEPWKLIDCIRSHLSPVPTRTLLLLDVKGQNFRASQELAQQIQSLSDSHWTDRTFEGRVQTVITISKDGGWAAFVVCESDQCAKKIKATLKEEVRKINVEFVEDDVIMKEEGRNSFQSDIEQSIKQNGISVDQYEVQKKGCAEAALGMLVFEGPSTGSANALHTEQVAIPMPGSVSKDHRKMPVVHSSKRQTVHISRWNAQQKELRADPIPGSPITDRSTSERREAQKESDQQVKNFNYCDEVKKACLLCQRQFKAVDVLRRHALESNLHQRNLQDAEICRAGQERKRAAAHVVDADKAAVNMKPAGFTVVRGGDERVDTEADPAYRDRALERRIVFGVDKMHKPKAQQGTKRKECDKDVPAIDFAPSEILSPATLDEASVGGALLAKMGWSAGQGLGASGTGRTKPVEALVYEHGAGIGSHRAAGNAERGPSTVEEHAAKRNKFIKGRYDGSARTQIMRQRYDGAP